MAPTWRVVAAGLTVPVVLFAAFQVLNREKPAAAAQFCGAVPAPVAHRGGTERAAENTLDAFKAAGAAGVTYWELDVHFDKNGTAVVLHDPKVDRTSPLRGNVRRLDATDAGIPTDDGQHVPTLREVYQLAGEYHAHVLTELKVTPTAAQWRKLAKDIDDTIGRDAVTIMSFQEQHVLDAAKIVPGTVRALVHETGALTADEVKSYGPVLNVHHGPLTLEQVRQWHEAGIEVLIWTVNNETLWEKFVTWPIDGFVTDKPIEYQRWASQRCNPWT
jgi:glycerophosphoryl diester phosphodiesterase